MAKFYYTKSACDSMNRKFVFKVEGLRFDHCADIS